ALGRSAQALPQLFQTRGVAHVEGNAVVVGEFFAATYGANRFDHHPIALGITAGVFHQDGLAVGIAAVIDPTRLIAAHIGVNDVVVVEREQEGMTCFTAVAILI